MHLGLRADRRGFLLIAAGLLSACAGRLAASSPAPSRLVPELAGLVPLADLRWLILTRPREVAAIPWLIPPVMRIAPEDNLTRFAAHTGFDLRRIPEAVIASSGGTIFYLVRHNGDPSKIEELFRARLTGHERRVAARPDVVRVSGKIGLAQATLVVLGADVVGFQFGGSAGRGPARIAELYALGTLKKSPTALAEEPLRSLAVRLGPAPCRAFAVGPFEGELARGARGLLAGATAIGATVRPSAREGLLVVIAVAGDFTTSGEAASRELLGAWKDLALGSFGHTLGLDSPVEQPLATHGEDAVAVAVEIDPGKLSRGIAALTSARLEEIMR